MLIVHRCLDCGHPDVWGERDRHSVLGLAGGLPDNCSQGCHPRCNWNPQPEVIARYDRMLEAIADVLPPGSEARWLTARTTHNCPACRDLHTQLTGGRPAAA